MDGKCISCSGVGGRTTCISPGFGLRDYRSHLQVNFASVKCPPKRASFRCTATYDGSRRNQDLPRYNNRNSYYRGRNRPMEDRDGLEDESDMLNLRNGSPKSHASTAPGQREQEIVELFRKVQVKLRERAGKKEEKAESGGGKGNESKTVESMLKLLRKHSVDQTRPTPNGSNKNQQPLGQQVSAFKSIIQEDDEEEEVQVPRSRPPSNFRRKSPVPRVTYEPVYQREVEPVAAELEVELEPELEEFEAEPELEEFEAEPELEEFEAEPEKVIIPDGGIYSEKFESLDSDEEDVSEEMVVEEEEYEGGEDLSVMKVVDLRALAKSRGLKGYSKMKKSDLLELLGGSSI